MKRIALLLLFNVTFLAGSCCSQPSQTRTYELRDSLQSAKICLHRKSLPLRAIASKGIVKELDTMEQAFDEAFIEMVSQEYYLRVFQDVFDEIFTARVDHLAVTLAGGRRK